MSDVLYPKSHIHFLRSRRHSRSRASTPIQVHVMAISAPCCLSQSFFLVLEYMYLVYALHAGRSAGASNAVASSGSGVTAPHFLPHTTRAQQLPYQLTWLRAGQQRVQRRDTHTYAAHLDVHEQIVRLFEDDADGHERWMVRMNSSKSGMKERTSINSRVGLTGSSHCASRISLPCSVSQANARRLSPTTLSSLGRRPSSWSWSRIAANWQLTPSWCGGLNHFRLTLVATARSAPWRRVLDTRKVHFTMLRVHTRLLTSHLKFTALRWSGGVPVEFDLK